MEIELRLATTNLCDGVLTWNGSNFNGAALNLEFEIKAGWLYFNNDFSSNQGIPKWILPMCTYIFVVLSVISEILCSFGENFWSNGAEKPQI